MNKLTDILKTHLIAYERVDGTGERIDNIASAEAAINQYISEIIGQDEPVSSTFPWSAGVSKQELDNVTRRKLRAEQRARAGITAKGDGA